MRHRCARIERYFPLSYGIPRVDDRRLVSGVIFVVRNGRHWRDAPVYYGPQKAIYNRFILWRRLGVFIRIFTELAAMVGEADRLMIDALPGAKAVLADGGDVVDWFCAALEQRGITPCKPSKANRKLPIPHDSDLNRQRHKVENLFGKLKDCRRIYTRYDRCAHTCMSAICIAATSSSGCLNES